MPAARVSGVVLTTNVVKGKSRVTGEPYHMEFARILVAERDITEVRIPDSMTSPIRGEEVDYLVELGIYANRLAVDAVEELKAA